MASDTCAQHRSEPPQHPNRKPTSLSPVAAARQNPSGPNNPLKHVNNLPRAVLPADLIALVLPAAHPRPPFLLQMAQSASLILIDAPPCGLPLRSN